jgi:hypothetical protein
LGNKNHDVNNSEDEEIRQGIKEYMTGQLFITVHQARIISGDISTGYSQSMSLRIITKERVPLK